MTVSPELCACGKVARGHPQPVKELGYYGPVQVLGIQKPGFAPEPRGTRLWEASSLTLLVSSFRSPKEPRPSLAFLHLLLLLELLLVNGRDLVTALAHLVLEDI